MAADAADAWVAAAPEGQRETLRSLREMVKSLGPDVVEEMKWGRPCYSSARGLFCYLQSTKNHASLGFQDGASLDDPHQLLEGSGKGMRHIKFAPHSAPDTPAVSALLRQAWAGVSR